MNFTPRKRQSLGWSPHKKKKCISSEEESKENLPLFFNEDIAHQNSSESMLDSCTPKKALKTVNEPVTPNTNFKLLTSLAASLDYANCSTPKSSRQFKDDVVCDSDLSELSSKKGNRKEKSLAVICTRFLSMYPINPPLDEKIIVSLDEACVKLGIERRRLYDIVNIFESIDIMIKIAKNQYRWFGKNNLTQSLKKLRAAALKERIPEKLQYIIDAEAECIGMRKQSGIFTEVQNFQTSNSPEILFPISSPPELRKEKSLGIMSQKFLMLFLVSPGKVISLGVAAKMLNGFFQRSEKSTQIKTQVRRLYDIANVLSSIGIIQKELAMPHFGKKPAFKYIGPDLENSFGVRTHTTGSSKQHFQSRSLIRHSSFQEICAVAEIEHQRLSQSESTNSAPPFESKLLQRNEKLKTKFDEADFHNPSPKLFDIKTSFKRLESQDEVSDTKTKVIHLMEQKYYSKSRDDIDEKELACQIDNKEEKAMQCSEDIPFSAVSSSLTEQQRDAILQILNVSLTSHQKAIIHLDGSNQNLHNSAVNTIKIIDKANNEQILAISPKDAEFSPRDLYSSKANNSPISFGTLDSHQSIPSAYVTPGPSNLLSMPPVESSDIMQNVEGENVNVLNRISDREQISNLCKNPSMIVQENNLLPKKEHRRLVLKQEFGNNKTFSAENLTPYAANGSCSSDSTSLELTNIFSRRNLEGSTTQKMFLIDEKTILSPPKKSPAQLPTAANFLKPSGTKLDTILVFTSPGIGIQKGKPLTLKCTAVVSPKVGDKKQP